VRRTREWYARLLPSERNELYYLERAAKTNLASSHLPEGYGDCGYCSTPTGGGGLCSRCNQRLNEIIAKGETEE
jgi:hypothetical protein